MLAVTIKYYIYKLQHYREVKEQKNVFPASC